MDKKKFDKIMDLSNICASCYHVLVVTILLTTPVISTAPWQEDPIANDHLRLSDLHDVLTFDSGSEMPSDFKLLYTEGDWMSVAARNKLHNISMVDLTEHVLKRIEWEPKKFDKHTCAKLKKTEDQCQNYITVFGKKSNDEVYICGTNAFKPMCRTYKLNDHEQYEKIGGDENGIAKSPYDPKVNSTAIYSDGSLFSATVANILGNDAVIIHTFKEDMQEKMIRSVQHDSKWLNDPNFVGSFDIEDKVYFFFRETAVENINCGKTVFSRVARVCKNDMGGGMIMDRQWTSFLKARLNCSIPGDFPFYFDEIQSTSLFSQGNFMSTSDAANRTRMFYAVFTTPQNSIQGSAICAFKYSDIMAAFLGKFKEKESVHSNWLPVPHSKTPIPHPAEKCSNSSKNHDTAYLNFIKSHPIMDMAVPAAGGAPLLIKTSLRSRFTVIAVDFQVHAADNRYYDIMFVGTDDGKVIKAINKGRGKDVETVVIEEIQVFDQEPVVSLKIYRDKGLENLVVISKTKIVSIPLHRCDEKRTCGSCVKLQDPYCSWVDEKCAASDRGIQSIMTGKNVACGNDDIKVLSESTPSPKTTVTTVPVVTTAAPPKCNCTCNSHGDKTVAPAVTRDLNGKLEIVKPVTSRPVVINSNDVIKNDELRREQADGPTEESSLSVAETAIAIVASIVLSSVLSFVAGYKVRSCRGDDYHNNKHYHEEYYGSLQKNHHLHKNIDKEPRYVNHSQLEQNNSTSQKQLNLLVNVSPKGSNLPNGNAQTKPIKNITVPDKTYV